MKVDPSNRTRSETYRLLTSTVVPRPIGWISTLGSDEVDNLAPFSYYNIVTPKPPVVMFSVSPPDDREDKDTLRNIRETGEFVCNLVTEPLVEAMDTTRTPIPADESEFDAAGLEREPSVVVDPPRVASAEVTMECRLYDELSVYENDVVLGDVARLHVDDDLLTDGKMDVRKVRAVGRLSGDYYASIDLMDFERSH